MAQTKAQQAERQEAINELRELLKPGDKVYTLLRHVSRSGMRRGVDVYVFRPNDAGQCEKLFLTGRVAKAIDFRYTMEDWHNSKGLQVGGCGTDVGFEVVYNLGRVLFPDGFDLPEGRRGRNGDTSGHDTDGGYALKQEWL